MLYGNRTTETVRRGGQGRQAPQKQVLRPLPHMLPSRIGFVSSPLYPPPRREEWEGMPRPRRCRQRNKMMKTLVASYRHCNSTLTSNGSCPNGTSSGNISTGNRSETAGERVKLGQGKRKWGKFRIGRRKQCGVTCSEENSIIGTGKTRWDRGLRFGRLLTPILPLAMREIPNR